MTTRAHFRDGKLIYAQATRECNAILLHRKRCSDSLKSYANCVMETNRFKLVAVATANKSARIAFALMRNEAHYADTPA